MSNFRLIARNTAGYVSHIGAHHSHEVRTDERVFASAGVVGVLPYNAQGRINLGDVVLPALRNRYSTTTLLPDRVNLYEGMARQDAHTHRLRNLRPTIEALIFSADMPRVDSGAILGAFRAKLGTVERALEKALQKLIPGTIYATAEARWTHVDLNRIRGPISAQHPG